MPIRREPATPKRFRHTNLLNRGTSFVQNSKEKVSAIEVFAFCQMVHAHFLAQQGLVERCFRQLNKLGARPSETQRSSAERPALRDSSQRRKLELSAPLKAQIPMKISEAEHRHGVPLKVSPKLLTRSTSMQCAAMQLIYEHQRP